MNLSTSAISKKLFTVFLGQSNFLPLAQDIQDDTAMNSLVCIQLSCMWWKLIPLNRVRLPSSWGWKKRVCSICEQFQLSKRFSDPKRECVNCPSFPKLDWLWVVFQCALAPLWLMRSSASSRPARSWSRFLGDQGPAFCSQVDREDDSKWPQKNKDGRQELEIRMGSEHISFEVWIRKSLWLKTHLLTDFEYRPQRLALLLMLRNRKIRKDCVSSTTLSKIWRRWYSPW